jgi:hypothetical protein
VPVKRVIVVIDKCIIDGLTHEIALDLDTVLIAGAADDGAGPVEVLRDAILTCPTTGRQFRATVPLPQSPGEVIAGVRAAKAGAPLG